MNDQLGHEAGDAVQLHAATRLKGALRGNDDIARFAGDEFVGLASTVKRSVVSAVIRNVQKALTFEITARAVERSSERVSAQRCFPKMAETCRRCFA